MFFYKLLNSAPAGLWPLSSVDAGVFVDQSGFDQDALASVAEIFVEPVAARSQKSLRIQGTQEVSFPYLGGMREARESRPFSIEFWIKSINDTGTFSLTRNDKGLTLSGNILTFDIGGFNVVSVNIEKDAPVHVAAVYTPNAGTLYVNGEVVDSFIPENVDFSLLTDTDLVAKVAGGRKVNLGPVAVYNSPLSPDDVLSHYSDGSDYPSVTNNAAGLAALRVVFDDRSRNVVYSSLNEYGPLTTGLVLNEDVLTQVFNPETSQYEEGTYLHLVQFDDQDYGQSSQARIDWEVIGDPTRVTVESSPDNQIWSPVQNHGITTNWSGLLDNEDFFLRVSISSGSTQVSVTNLSITVFSGSEFASSYFEVKAGPVEGDVATGHAESNPAFFRNNEGITLSAANKGLKVDTHADFGNAGAVEMIINSNQQGGTLLDNGSNRIWRDGAGLHIYGFDRVVINGEEVFELDTDVREGWLHIVAVFSTANNNLTYVGASNDGTDPLDLQISYLALHSSKLTLEDIETLYGYYVGAEAVRFSEQNQVLVNEHSYPGGENFLVYALDWAVTSGGTV